MIQMGTGPWVGLFGSVFPTLEEALATRGKFALGFFLIFLQCLIIVGNAMLTQYIFDEEGLESPFIMTYIGVASLMIGVPVHLFLERRRAVMMSRASDEASFDSFESDMEKYNCYADLVDICARRTLGLVNDHERVWNHRKHLMAAILITPALFLADWAFNAALLSTSVASSTLLVSTQSIFVYIMAVVLSLELSSNWKLVGILAGIAGTALTALHDVGINDDEMEDSTFVYSDVIIYTYNSTLPPEEFAFPTTHTWGDTLAVLAAVAYAANTIQVRLFCPANEDLYSMNLLLGYMGVVGFFPLLPVALWLFLSEQIHMSWRTFFLVFVKGIFDFLISDYMLFRSIILTGPTVATVGLGMSIPFAFLGDVVMGREDVFTLPSIMGAVACIIGFLIVNLAPSSDEGNAKSVTKEQSLICEESNIESLYRSGHVVL